MPDSPALRAPDTSSRALIRLAWPLFIANLAVVGNGTIDAIMAGRLSATDLAAVAIGSSIYVTVYIGFMGVLQALSPIAGHHYGARRWRAIGDDVQQALWLSLLLTAAGLPCVLATDLWLDFARTDDAVGSVATLYLRNLATHMLTPGKPNPSLRPWAEPTTALRVSPDACRPIDLRAAANRSFSDEADGDGKGGWTDQGSNDFSTMPLGDQVLQGVPFTILDPAANADRSCIVLGGGGRPQFPREVLGIPVGGCADRLFFLHTAAWMAPRGTTVLTYRITYADGVRSDIPVRSGFEIADWWNPGELRGALLGLTQTNAQLKDIALFMMPWDNPRPDQPIVSIDSISAGTSVPVVVAITAESGNTKPARFLGAADPKAWKLLVEWPGRDAQREGAGLPTVGAASSDLPGAVRISYPEAPAPSEVKDRYWGAPTAFTTLPAAELARLSTGPIRQLSFWIRSSQVGTLDLVLPCHGWKNSLQATVSVDPAHGWRKVRLDLATDMLPSHSRNWKLADLKGELFLYHGRRIARDAPRPAALDIEIADPRLE
jgi:beta-galactosidase